MEYFLVEIRYYAGFAVSTYSSLKMQVIVFRGVSVFAYFLICSVYPRIDREPVKCHSNITTGMSYSMIGTIHIS